MSAYGYGLLAEFESGDQLIEAVRRAREAGYDKLEAYTPFPVEGLHEALGRRPTWLPLLVLGGGIAGAALGYALQYYCNVVDYPINIGGRPMNSWPAFLVVTFEMTVLIAALAAVVGMLALNRLPMPHHPLFDVAAFERASQNRFFLCIRTSDPYYHPDTTPRFLQELKACGVWEVPDSE